MDSDLKEVSSSQIQGNFNWNDLFFYLDNKLVVPVIGSKIFWMREPINGVKTLLYDHMHRSLCEGMPEEQRDDDFWEFMEKNKENNIAQRIKVFLNHMNDEIDKNPLLKLAQITDFQEYICMTYDNFFQPILEAERCSQDQVIQTIDFSINNNSQSQPLEEQSAVATIFNLMGSINKINGFAKTEEEVLEHLYSLTKENLFTNRFFSDIEEKHFLFIGCNFPNWLLRFFIRIISRERLNDKNITKIIADYTTYSDPKLCMFLNHYNSKIYQMPNATALEFINELYQRWTERKPQGSQNKIKYEGVVFLSYSSEDRSTFVEELYQELLLNGVNVFYDQTKLDSGDYFTQKIGKAITHCKLFISLISSHSLDPDRYVTKEIETAMAREQFFVASGEERPSFIRPYIIDDTPGNTPRLQELFKHISIRKENNVGTIVQSIISDLER